MATEVEVAIKNMINGKATRPDNIETEFLKLLNEAGIKWSTKIFNNIYDTGDISKECLKSEFIALLKKIGAKNCEEYYTISIMSHILKLF